MQILFLSNEFPNATDRHKATFNYDMVMALAKNHGVQVISPISWLDELRARFKSGFKRWEKERDIEQVTVFHPRFFYTPGILRNWYGTFLWWSIRSEVATVTADIRPDCIVSYWAHPDGEACVRLARQLQVPSIVMVGGSDVLLLARESKRRKCIQSVLTSTDAVVCMSRDLAEHVIAMGVSPNRVHIMRRGVDTSKFAPASRSAARNNLGLAIRKKMLLWVGRMVPVKGLDTLLAACALLRERGIDFQLFLVGDGPLRQQLEAEVERLDLKDNIFFQGSVKHQQLGDWYRAADLTLLPSRSEGIPNVLLESLACGTPYIASAVGGIPEISSGPGAILVPPNSPDQWASAISCSLQSPCDISIGDSQPTLESFANNIANLAANLASSTLPDVGRRPPSVQVGVA